MVIFEKTFEIKTNNHLELVDITPNVENIVHESKIKEGICLVYVPHATAAIITNEYEPYLIEDILKIISDLFPKNEKWKHNTIDDNAHAHLASIFLGSSKVFPISNGKLVKGTWQQIIFVELDGPRSYRKIVVKIIGE